MSTPPNPKPILSCEHATEFIPKKLEPYFPSKLFGTHESYDLGALPLAKLLAKSLGGQGFYGSISRLAIDLNRDLANPHITRLKGEARERYFMELRERYYAPYRLKVKEAIATELASGSTPVVHLSIHSFTRIFKDDERKTDIGILYDDTRAGELRFARTLQKFLQKAGGYRVHRNRPYYGKTDGHTSKLRSFYSEERYLGIEIEVCNDLLGEENLASMASLLAANLGLAMACL